MAAASLKDRFLLSALSPLNFFLNLTGVFLQQPDSKRKQGLFIFWSYFCLAMSIQSNVFIFIKRSQLQNIFSYQELSTDKLTRHLVNELFRFNACILHTFIHFYLIISIRPTVTLFLETFEFIDSDLKTPALPPCVKRSSLTGLLYMVFTVRLIFIRGDRG